MVFGHGKSHPRQFLLELLGSFITAVGEEQVLFIFLLEPFDKFLYTGEQFVAVIDHAIHVADKTFFCIEINFFHNSPSEAAVDLIFFLIFLITFIFPKQC